MSKHTPLPWRLCPDSKFSSEIESADGALSIAMAHAKGHELLPDTCEAPEDDVSDANAAFIVRAVNAHDDLVSALKSARTQLEIAEQIISGESFNDTQINSAIAKAEGK